MFEIAIIVIAIALLPLALAVFVWVGMGLLALLAAVFYVVGLLFVAVIPPAFLATLFFRLFGDTGGVVGLVLGIAIDSSLFVCWLYRERILASLSTHVWFLAFREVAGGFTPIFAFLSVLLGAMVGYIIADPARIGTRQGYAGGWTGALIGLAIAALFARRSWRAAMSALRERTIR